MNRTLKCKRRAISDQEKEEIINNLLLLWKRVPKLRLGQLLSNSLDGDLFFVEDYELVSKVENLLKKIT